MVMAMQTRTSTALTVFPPSSTSSPYGVSGGIGVVAVPPGKRQTVRRVVCTAGGSGSGSGGGDAKKKAAQNSNYAVPLDKYLSPSSSSYITRPLVEILRDLNRKIPENILKARNHRSFASSSGVIPWYHANRMLSFYAPGWCGEVHDVIFSENGNVTVVYRLTLRGSDGEAHRESTGTVSARDDNIEDPVAAAEEIAFCRACARFGLGLYLYHED